MKKIRIDVARGLGVRMLEKIPIRQPLTKFEIKNKYDDDYIQLIKDELNVKEVIQGAKEYGLEVKIPPELRQEGNLRELVRQIQDLRKKSGLVPQQKIKLIIETNADGEKLIKNFENEIKKSTNTSLIKFTTNSGQEIKIDELILKIEIKK